MADSVNAQEPENVSTRKPVRTVLIGMDGSKHSVYTLEWYAKMLAEKDDEVLIIHCAESEPKVSPLTLLGGNLEAIHTMIKQQEAHEKEVLKTIEDTTSKYEIKHTLKRVTGHAGEMIVKEADKEGADIILVGSRGHGTVRRTVMGSVSDYIVHHSHIPVLICKHEHHLKV